MTDSELIARQARRIAELEEQLEIARDAIKRAVRHIVRVGGPLNDNKLGYTPEQLVTFHGILGELET